MLRLLEAAARAFALLGGSLLTLVTAIACASIVGRELLGKPLTGDFELVAATAGAVIALFLPWCQLKRGNIIVDFFTTRASAQTQLRLDRFGALLMAAMMAVLAWRASVGGVAAFRNGSGTMILGFPEWIVYVFLVPGLALCGLIALVQAATKDAE